MNESDLKPSPDYELRSSGWFRLSDGSGPYFLDEAGMFKSMGESGVVTLHNFATNGETFPNDSQTEYTYDQAGVNITQIKKTAWDGRVFIQTWTRDGQSQLSLKSGWVKQ